MKAEKKSESSSSKAGPILYITVAVLSIIFFAWFANI